MSNIFVPDRIGKITASKASVLLVNGKKHRFGDTAVKYAYMLAQERISGFNIQEYFEGKSKHTEFGHKFEEDSAMKASQVYGLELVKGEFTTSKKYPNVGATPDYISVCGKVAFELKNPSVNFLRYFLNESDLCEDYEAQVFHQFVAFDKVEKIVLFAYSPFFGARGKACYIAQEYLRKDYEGKINAYIEILSEFDLFVQSLIDDYEKKEKQSKLSIGLGERNIKLD